MKRKFLFTAMLCCTALFNANAQWAPKQNMTVPSSSTGLGAAQCFSLNGKIYVGGGYYAMFQNTNDFYMYDPANDQWTPKGDLPGAPNRSGGIAFSINGKGYIGLGAENYSSISGVTLLTDLWRYNPDSNTWMQMASLPDTGRFEAGCFVANNKVYVVGGAVTTGGFATNDLWEYDPVANQWAPKMAYPLGSISAPFAWGAATSGYVSCGYVSPNWEVKTYEYSPTGNSWTPRADYPGSAGSDGVAFVLNTTAGNKAYCGLNRQQSNYYTDFYAYDMATQSWGPAIPFTHGGRANGVAAATATKAYVGMGWKPASSTVYFKDWYEYPTTVGIESINVSINAHVYPNPAHGSFSIVAEGKYQYELYSISGQRMLAGDAIGSKEVGTTSLANGLYILKISTGKGISTQKLQIDN